MSDHIAEMLAAQAKGAPTVDPVGEMLRAKARSMPSTASDIDPSEGRLPFEPFGINTGLSMPQGVSRFMAGAGKAFVDLGRGAGQLARDGIETIAPPTKGVRDLIAGTRGTSFADRLGLPTREDIDEAHRLDAPLMKTGAGLSGNIGGNAAALLPTMLIPGAATIGGGAAIGALASALQPVGTGESRLQNMAVGGVAGAALPAAIRAGKMVKAGLIDPFTEAGRQHIVGRTLSRAATDPVRAAQNMRSTTGSTPGFLPTAAQAADDAGIASVERTARAIDPGGFGDVDRSQRGALITALRGIAKTPEDKAIAEAARDTAVKPLYDAAKRATIPGDDAMDELMKRPSMQAAAEEASNLARERGSTFALSKGVPAQDVPTGLLDASGAPIVTSKPAVPATYSGQSMHDLKMGLDTAIQDPARGFMGAKRDAALGTRDEFLQWLESKAPEYGRARTTYAEMSRPVNQMEIGQELYNRLVPALADGGEVPFKMRADAFAQALRNGDQVAKNVTGLKGASMAGIMEPEQMSTLQGVVKDAQLKAAAEGAGRGVGSDTVQKMSMSNLIDQAGLPTWVSGLAPLRSIGGMARTAGDILYTKNDETMRHLLANALQNPLEAAAAMQKAAGVSPKAYARLLQATGQSAAISSSMTANPPK